MKKSFSIALIIFSTSVCLSQNSEINVKDISSTTSTSKSGLEVTAKSSPKEEATGRTPMINLGTPTIEPYSPSNENSDQKKSINGKNEAKPH